MGAIAILVILAQLFLFFYTGYTAWEWVKPEAFFDYFKFAILWAILEAIAFNVLLFVSAIVAHAVEQHQNTHE
jgi:ABC-type arginine/histidine transport system permease subunit